MRHVLAIVALGLASCGGPPALKNAPHPNNTAVAGAAAAAAAAVTLADPDAATPEKPKPNKSDRPVEGGGTVPASVLDRLDAKQQAPKQEVREEDLTSAEIMDAPPLPPPVVREDGED